MLVCVHVCVPGEGGVGHHVHMLVCGLAIVGARPQAGVDLWASTCNFMCFVPGGRFLQRVFCVNCYHFFLFIHNN